MFYAPGGEHFYTSSNIERATLIKEYLGPLYPSWTELWPFNNPNHYWDYEGDIGLVYNFKADGTVPLYRLFNGNYHMYTIDPNERDNIIATLGFHSEGISGYVYPTASTPGTQPVHRYVGTSSIGHFFTTNYNEIGSGSGAGLAYEGIAFYTIAPTP
jgi:hypothetical protein